MSDDLDLPVDEQAVAADEAFVTRLARDAVSWDHAPDDITAAFAALRADIGVGLPAPSVEGATVVPFDAARRRRGLHGRRVAVAASIGVVVLSASGVAAAGSLSTHRADVGHSVYTFFHGTTASEKAAGRTARLLDDAESDLAARPRTLGKALAARAAVLAAGASFGHVDPADAGDLAERLADLTDRVNAAIASLTPVSPESGGSEPGDRHGSGGSDDGSSGSTDGGSGDHQGSGDDGTSGSSGGSDDGGSTSTGSGGSDGGSSSGSTSGSDDGGSTSTGSGGSDSGSSSGSTSGSEDGVTSGGSDTTTSDGGGDSTATAPDSGSNDGSVDG